MTTIKTLVAIIITLLIIQIGDKNKMPTLPGGFSPLNAVKQIGSVLNPTGGVSNYDVFSGLGNTHPDNYVAGAGAGGSGGSWTSDPTTTSSLPSIYYDANSGGIVTSDGLNAVGNPIFDASGNRINYTQQNTPTVDPYAKYGGRAAYDSMRSGFGVQKQGILDSIGSWGDNTATKYASGITDLIQNYRNSQDALNRQAATNEAQKLQGTQGILGALGRGVKSGMTMLGNRNAGSSSAAGEIARAYGDIARRDQSGVNNQYATGNEDIAVQQNLLGQDMGTQQRKFKENMDMEINSKVEEARNALSALDAQIAGASLPDRIAIDQEKQNIKNQLIAKLQGYDQQLATGIQGIAPASREQNLATAQQRLAAGQVPETAFAFTDQIPAQFQNTGGQASGLPLFTLNNKRRQTA